MNLLTSEDIEYDPAVLKQMDQKELTYQLLCHALLERPRRPHQLAAKQLQADVAAQVKEIVQSLRDGGLEQFAQAVEESLAKYEAAYDVGEI